MTERRRGKERKDIMYVCIIKKKQRRKEKEGKREREWERERERDREREREIYEVRKRVEREIDR